MKVVYNNNLSLGVMWGASSLSSLSSVTSFSFRGYSNDDNDDKGGGGGGERKKDSKDSNVHVRSYSRSNSRRRSSSNGSSSGYNNEGSNNSNKVINKSVEVEPSKQQQKKRQTFPLSNNANTNANTNTNNSHFDQTASFASMPDSNLNHYHSSLTGNKENNRNYRNHHQQQSVQSNTSKLPSSNSNNKSSTRSTNNSTKINNIASGGKKSNNNDMNMMIIRRNFLRRKNNSNFNCSGEELKFHGDDKICKDDNSSRNSTARQFSHLSEVSLFHSTNTTASTSSTATNPIASSNSTQNTRSSSLPSSAVSSTSTRSSLSTNNEERCEKDSSSTIAITIPQSDNNSKRAESLERKWLRLADDPSVEESIECVFSHQMQEEGGIALFDDYFDHDNEDDDNNKGSDGKHDHNLSGSFLHVGSYTPSTHDTNGAHGVHDDAHHNQPNDHDRLSNKKITRRRRSHSRNRKDRNTNTDTQRRRKERRNRNRLPFGQNHNANCNNIEDNREQQKKQQPQGEKHYAQSDPGITFSALKLPLPSPSSTSLLSRTLSNAVKFVASPSSLILSKTYDNKSQGRSATKTTTPTRQHYKCVACQNGTNKKPPMDDQNSLWPQSPLLLRPTPGSGTRIRSVRFAETSNANEYLMDTSRENPSISFMWWDELHNRWKNNNCSDGENNKDNTHDKHEDKVTANSVTSTSKKGANTNNFCQECCILPINNGNEKDGQALVVDFESDLFEGTLQLRIRRSNGTTAQPYDDSFGFFHGRNRQYQCVISGRFKREGIAMTECITGMFFNRPLRLPAPYITNGAIKLVKFFAPRLQVKMKGPTPMAISPLGSTPQSIQVDECSRSVLEGGEEEFRATDTIIRDQEEPSVASRHLIHLANKSSKSSSSMARAKVRKKAFDKLCGLNDKTKTFQTDKVYTFEFLQHLVDFDSFEMNLGSILGKFKLCHTMNEQPLNIMAAHQQHLDDYTGFSDNTTTVGDHVFEKLWSFDLWHESIIKAK